MTTRKKTSPPVAKAASAGSRRDSPSPAGTKRSDATRLRILDAAAYVLSQKGFAGTKLSDIAQQADLQISAPYYYFESREALILDVLLSGSAHVRTHVADAVARLAPDASPIERVCSAVEAHLRYVLQISHYTAASVRNTGQLPPHLREAVDKEHTLYGRFWQGLIDAAADENAYPTPQDRRTLRLLLVGALNASVERMTTSRSAVDRLVHTALTLTRSVLAPAPRQR